MYCFMYKHVNDPECSRPILIAMMVGISRHIALPTLVGFSTKIVASHGQSLPPGQK